MDVFDKTPEWSGMERERLRGHIAGLDRAVSRRPDLACGVVRLDGDTALNVIRLGSLRRSVEVTAVDAFGAAWFAWASDGSLIGSVDDCDGVAHAIALELGHAVRP
ncbi:hypothetical protein [Actinomadura roseirufa]|uniref:hypothetical protein n=1 Tax=Actinomadura roseirufa TaxID=2094049 RepID=UPI001040E5F1|nr:hypothetical protein [Actinomadura roseirufa]